MAERNENGQFVKGHKGFPTSGRPKREVEHNFLEFMKEFMDETKRKKLLTILWNKVIDGDMQAIKLFIEYLGGKPQINVDISSKGERIGFSILDEMNDSQRAEYFSKLSVALSRSEGSDNLENTESEKE